MSLLENEDLAYVFVYSAKKYIITIDISGVKFNSLLIRLILFNFIYFFIYNPYIYKIFD